MAETQEVLPIPEPNRPDAGPVEPIVEFGRSLRGLPFASDFERWLWTIGHARKLKSTFKKDRRGIEREYENYLLLDGHQTAIVKDGRVSIPCIGCGSMDHEPGAMVPVKVGCIIQVLKETESSPFYTKMEWSPRPQVRSGLGCPSCADKFFAASLATNALNKQRLASYDEACRTQKASYETKRKYEWTLKLLEAQRIGQPLPKLEDIQLRMEPLPKSPAPLTPWIDVASEVMAAIPGRR
jgi:hypothetical protein